MLHVPLPSPTDREHRHAPDHASKYTALFSLGLRLSDIAVLWLGGVLAYWMRFGTFEMPFIYDRVLISAVVLGAFVLAASPLYRSWRGRGLDSELLTLLGTFATLFVLLAVYSVALKTSADISRVWRLCWFFNALAGGITARVVVRNVAAWTRSAGMDVRTAVVVGNSNDAVRIIDALHRNRSAGIQLLGRFQSEAIGKEVHGTPYLGDIEALGEFVEQQHVNQVWIALPMSEQAKINRVLQALAHSAADIKFVPDLFGLHLLNHSIEQMAGLPVINLQRTPLQGENRLWKALEDRLMSALILVAISPLMALIAIAVKLSSPGPVFYRQERVSWNNKTFQMLKFRSMPVNAEAVTGAIWANAGESRATAVGGFLRRTSLDELPQFINVLRGEMSIVGPRPERPVFVEKFKHEIPAYMKKHMVKAGITGWAQVNGWRGSTDLQRRIECDLYYVENWSLMLDLKIILMTFFKGFVHKNAY